VRRTLHPRREEGDRVSSEPSAASEATQEEMEEGMARFPLEIRLRRERSRIDARIASAARRAEELRGNGRRDGDPELEDALEEVRRLTARQAALPDEIVDAVAHRCRAQAAKLQRGDQALAEERAKLLVEAQEKFNQVQLARRDAQSTVARLQSVENRREELAQRARPFETFADRAREFEGQRQKRMKLLEDAKHEGLLLPFAAYAGVPSLASENGSA
jgi:hypothetical protein